MKFNAFIPSAGLGTRLYPLTANKPKALVEIGGKPLLEHTIEKLINQGVQEIVINVHHFAEQIINFIARKQYAVPIFISDEREQLLNTGGGLKKAIKLFNTPFPILVHNVDVYSNLPLQILVTYHMKHKALATLVVRERNTSRYLQFDEKHLLCGWLNKATQERKIVRDTFYHKDYAFSGLHIVSHDILPLLIEQGAFSIIDSYLRISKEHRIVAFTDRIFDWMDLGKYEQIEEATRLFERTQP